MKEYRYACNEREFNPITYAGVPKEGLKSFIFNKDMAEGKYGDVIYSRQLTTAEIIEYGLMPVEMPPVTEWHIAYKEYPKDNSLVLIATKDFTFIAKAIFKAEDETFGMKNVFIETNIGIHDTFYTNDINYWAYTEED